jgi:fumarylacetoacetate (FAA) hydrolase family protein
MDETPALVGRVWLPGVGPAIVHLREGRLVDVTRAFPTMRDLCEAPDPAHAVGLAAGTDLGPADPIIANADPRQRNPSRPWLIAPCDLQAVKAAGVTFVVSMLERVIEEAARGDAARSAGIRERIAALIGPDIAGLRPGSPEAAALKSALIEAGAWSQYLEVGIGPDAEIFTKCQPMAAVGSGAEIGVHPASVWNNPEPEVVLAIASDGRVVGATLGNDVNLRDIEGRSALLLGKAKDNNAAAAIGPFIRLFDAGFDLAAVGRLELALEVEGTDGFLLRGRSSMARISRSPAEIAAQAINRHHPYPDGLMLFLGTMFAPVEDRDAPGKGFTHHEGDVVSISCPELGRLVNRVTATDRAEGWAFGAAHLMRNLAARGLLGD